MQLNLRDIAETWCEKCNKRGDVIDKDCEDCLDTLLKLHQTIVLQEIAGHLKSLKYMMIEREDN